MSAQDESPRHFLMRPISLKILSVALVTFIAWIIYLDAQVRYRYEGKRWSLPAQVYARSLEIYEDRPLNLRHLEWELKQLGYKAVRTVSQPGQYRIDGQRAELFTRDHVSPDGIENAAHFRFSVRADQVSNLTSLDGSSQALYSVDPIKVGGIYPREKEERILLAYDEFPPALVSTLILVEDRGFSEHWGVSPLSIARAALANLKAGRIVQGGSTLTQQLVKNFFLSRERSLSRKINEALMALLLEMHYDKQSILETYMNDIFLGQAGNLAIHGFEAASWFYFGSSVKHLDWPEYALLVAMIKGPSYYNPRRFPERATKRRNLVLKVLHQEGVLDTGSYEKALQAPLQLVDKPKFKSNRYPAFLDLVKRQLQEEYNDEDLSSEGLKVYTTIDPQLQNQLESVARSRLKQLEPEPLEPILQTGAVVSDTGTGELLALVGDRNPNFKGFNRAIDASRAVGSLIKPAIYLTALEMPEKYSLATTILDQGFRIEFEDGQTWQPQNFDEEEHGPTPLGKALAKSYNLSTARLGLDLGIDAVHKTLRKLGVERDLNPYPSLFLGAQSLTPLEVSQFYQTIASNGFNMPLRSIREVTDSDGKTLKRYPFQIEQVIAPQAIFLLRHAMIEVMKTGTGRSAYWKLPQELILAGKTGTTNDNRDSWFSGFSGDYLATVWIGRDDNQPTHLTGSSGALRLWTDFMQRVPQYPLTNTAPRSIDYYWVNKNGEMTDDNCADAELLPVWGEPRLEYKRCDAGYTSLKGWIKSWF